MRKIAIVTGTRAEYGLLYWIIKGVHEDPELKLQLIVTGMHLSPEFGMTVNEIERDGFPIADKVEMLLSADTESAIAASMGLGMIGLAKAYQRLKSDILLVLGDRFEILSAAAAAVPFRIPVAHIHGGESTEGAMDEQFRHAITKMSHMHFTANEGYRKRVIQMGEDPERVYCFGAPGLDNIRRLRLMDRKRLLKELDIPAGMKIGVVTFHPETLGVSAESDMEEMLEAVKERDDIFWIFTMPNADTGGRVLIGVIYRFISANAEISRAFMSLGQLRYLSLLKHADLMLGNSSSGIIEAPSFGLPVLNIGQRQAGRLRGKSVIDLPLCRKTHIVKGIEKALSPGFRRSLKGMGNPYGDGNASMRIVRTLKTVRLGEGLIRKRFYEV